MHKELVICIILVTLIIIGDIITQNYTKNTVNYITNELETLKQGLIEKSKEQVDDKINKIDEKWNEAHDKLAYYIEHDELEKVETNFTACKSLAKTEEYEQAISELEKTVYVLEHITDKYSFDLVNIF
ncbi:MAG: DUF4363 family protein [Clostridia bacterium]